MHAPPQSDTWISGWYSPIDSKGPAIPAQSIRHWIRSSIDGRKIRIHLSNRFGETPLSIASVFVAKGHFGEAVINRQVAVRFNGEDKTTIVPGKEIISDAIELPILAFEELAVSFYLPEGATTTSLHNTSMQNAYIDIGRNSSNLPLWEAGKLDDTRFFLSQLEVEPNSPASSIVVLGDSLTDGVGIDNDHYHRWTDFLAERLQADPETQAISVVNAGVAGNRLLHDAKPPFIGDAGVNRFNHDVLRHANIQTIIVSQGTNDISANFYLKESSEHSTFEQLILAYQELIEKAHRRGVKVFGTTIKPRGGSQGLLAHTEAAEQLRIKVNQWIRESKAFDAVLDFDLALRDPKHPDRLLAKYDSGDHTHPNALGYKLLAECIPLELFK